MIFSERANPTYADFFSGSLRRSLLIHALNSSTLIGVIFMIRFTPLPSENLLV